ncbi:hypothetical protein PHAVU_008G109466 [Phaseolus vulgaris]
MTVFPLLVITTALPNHTFSPQIVIIFYADFFRSAMVTATIPPRAPFIIRTIAPYAGTHFASPSPCGLLTCWAKHCHQVVAPYTAQPILPSLALYPSLLLGYYTGPLMAQVHIGLGTI